jgi:hypothetical protein
MFIKINNNCLYLPYNSLDRSWFPLFFRINCAKIGVLMYFSYFFGKRWFWPPRKIISRKIPIPSIDGRRLQSVNSCKMDSLWGKLSMVMSVCFENLRCCWVMSHPLWQKSPSVDRCHQELIWIYFNLRINQRIADKPILIKRCPKYLFSIALCIFFLPKTVVHELGWLLHAGHVLMRNLSEARLLSTSVCLCRVRWAYGM